MKLLSTIERIDKRVKEFTHLKHKVSTEARNVYEMEIDWLSFLYEKLHECISYEKDYRTNEFEINLNTEKEVILRIIIKKD